MVETKSRNKPPVVSRRSRNEWLDLALLKLPQAGKTSFHLDSLLGAMKASKGSFYHHFRDKEDFERALVHHWDEEFTQTAIDGVESGWAERTAEENLVLLIETVLGERLMRLDLLMHSLAKGDPYIAKLVAGVEESRFKFATKMFAALGFSEVESAFRARALVAIMSHEVMTQSPVPPAKVKTYARDLQALFTAS